ncbi:MAG: efflux RND transporter permease subunit, partial [Erythrobacter sp.]
MDFRNISAWSIRNPVIPLVLFTALLLAGIVSFLRMDVTNNPDVEFPAVIVSIAQPGAAPTEIENQITQRVESAVRAINGVNSIQSTASEGSSQTVVEFEVGTEIIEAVNEVETAIDGVRASLPDGILEPQISKVNVAGGPIGYFAVEADDMTIEQLSWFIDDTVAKQLLNVEGMAEVGRFGGVDREIEVILDPAKMQAFGVTASQINGVLRQNNINAAGGLAEVGGTRQSLRVLGNDETAFDLSQRQIQLGGGRTIRLADVATVRDGYSERTSISEVRDKEVVNFYMNRARGASDLATYDGALEVIEEIEAANEGVEFISLGTSTTYTEGQYLSSMQALIEGALLAIVVVFLFLRDWRATFISAVAIPLSAIPTFFFMDLLGFNLNFLSLLALALVAGVLVDDAIVEIENIVRHMRMGKSAYQASIDAADEIGLPVVATSFCIVAVFLPVGLMPGISGQFFQNFGLTVVVAVLMSLAVARMITPLMAAYFMAAKGHGTHGEGPWMDRYMRLLGWTLDTGKMNERRARSGAPRSRALYIVFLLLTVLAMLVATGVTMFASFEAIKALEIPTIAADTLIGDGSSTLYLVVSKIFEIVQVLLVSLLAFVAGYAVLLVVELIGRGASTFRYLAARFYDHRVWMLAVGWFSLLVTVLLFGQIPGQFQPNINVDESTVQIEMVPGTTLAQTKRVVDEVADILYEQPEVDLALERIRIGEATLYVNLKPADERGRTSIEFEREVAPLFADVADARVRFQSQSAGFGSGRDITVMLAGSDPELLDETAATLVEQMRGLVTLIAPRISADLNRPEILITPRDQIAAELGVSTLAISQTIRIATLVEIEQNAARFSLSDRQIPIRVKLSEESRTDLSTIENLPVQTLDGGTVPLARVAEISFGSGPTAIQRYNQNRRTLVGADLA